MQGFELDVARLLVGLAILLHASYSDLKTRTAENWHWHVIGGVGFVIYMAQLALTGAEWVYFLGALAPYLLFLFFLQCEWLVGDLYLFSMGYPGTRPIRKGPVDRGWRKGFEDNDIILGKGAKFENRGDKWLVPDGPKTYRLDIEAKDGRKNIDVYEVKQGINWLWITVLALTFAIPAYVLWTTGPGYEMMLTLSPVWMIWLFYLFYRVNLVHGGGDAKALMSISLLLPAYPSLVYHAPGTSFFIGEVPQMGLILTPSFSVMVNAALITVFLPLVLIVYNLSTGVFSLYGFLGYRMKVDKIKDSFVWSMQYVDNGELKTSVMPRKMKDEEIEDNILKLKKMGIEEVWVTPKIAFLVSITIGYALLFFVGGLMFELMALFYF